MKSLKILSTKCSKASGTAVCLDKVLEKYIPFSGAKYINTVICKRNAEYALIDADLDEVIDFIIKSIFECSLHDDEILIETTDILLDNKVLVEIKCANGHHFVSMSFDRFTGIPKDVISDSGISAVLSAVNSAVYLLMKARKITEPKFFTDENDKCHFSFSATQKMRQTAFFD